MARVSEVLKQKGSEVFTIERAETVYRAIELMESRRVGALVVTGDGTPCGMITERDYLRKIALKGRSSKTTRVDEIMSTPVICATPDDSVERCMSMMTKQRCRHLPIVSGGALAGIVSIGDLVKQIGAEQESDIRFLSDYIAGKYPG
jgi:CBS domain-containing protein